MQINNTKYLILNTEDGVATTIVILILSTVFVLMGFVFAFRGVSKLEEAQIAIDGDKAEYAAKSGVDEALLQLRRDPAYPGAANVAIEKDSAGNTKSSVNISVTPLCRDISGDTQCVIKSKGAAGSAIKILVVKIKKDPAYESFHPMILEQYFE